MRRMKFIFAAITAVLLAGCCCGGTLVNVPMDKSWKVMRHTRDAKCTVVSDGVKLTNPNQSREYAAMSRKYTVDLTSTPWIVVRINEVDGRGGEFKVVCGRKKVQFLTFDKPGVYQINLANLLKEKGKKELLICCYVLGVETSAVFSGVSFADKSQKLPSSEPPFYIVPTFINAAYYYTSDNIGTLTPFFRKKGDKEWQKGIDAAYDPVTRQYRGSVVRLKENTGYELKITDQDGNTVKEGSFTTWADKVKIARTIVLDPAKITKQLVIRTKGKPDGWIRYIQKPGTVIAPKFKGSVIRLDNARYVILDGLKIKGGEKHAVEVNGCQYVRISNCEISGWGIVGEQRCDYNGRFHVKGKSPSGYGINFNGAINIYRGKGIVVERCYIHDPKNRANSWFYSHPAGPQAVTAASPESSVIRYNDFVGSDEHRFNDAVESLGNFNDNGGLNRDADVYGNFMIYCSDDNIELDGGQRNVRCFDNRFEGSYCGVSIQGCMMGPSYVYNNIFLNMADEFGATGYTLKSCSGQKYGPHARSYIFNNTFVGNGAGTNIDNIMDYRNNIWGGWRWIDGSHKPHTDFANVFERTDRKDPNLHSSTMQGDPKLKNISKADLRLSKESPFRGKGVEIPNFAPGKNIDPGAFLGNKDIPVRPLPVSVAPGQLNFACDNGKISGDGNVLVKGTCKKFSGKFTIRKNDVFDWFEVTPASGIIRNGSSLKLTVRIKPGFEPKYRMYRGAFLVRFENGFSRPMSVYMKTDFKAAAYPEKAGVYTQYIDLTRPTGGKQYPVIDHPSGGNGKVLDFKTRSYPVSSKKFIGSEEDLAEYEFEIPETGEYMIMLRGMNQYTVPGGSGCFSSLDGSSVEFLPLTYHFSPENRMSWVFLQLPQSMRKAHECKVVKLTRGKHVLRIAPRKPIYLDSLCITSDPRIFEER